MGIIENLKDRVSLFNQRLTSGVYIQDIVADTESVIIDMNAESQLFEEGVTSKGVKISDYAPYAQLTIEIKRTKGQPVDRVTLRDEGDFHKSFYLDFNNEQFEIKASNWKTEELIRQYGREILGLTDENIASLIWDYLYPDLLETTKRELYGKH